jgi:hypothetical protein
MTMGALTLTVQNIEWCCQRYNNKLAYGFGKHAIVYDIVTGFFHIKESGETVFVAKTMVECLEVAHEYVFESLASKIIPSWETSDPFTAN